MTTMLYFGLLNRIKQLEETLDSLESDFGSYVYHTTDGQFSQPYDVDLLCAEYDDRIKALVAEAAGRAVTIAEDWLFGAAQLEAANAELRNGLAKAEADKAALVEALKDAESALSLMHHRKHDDLICPALTKVCDVLARVKGEL